MENNYVVNVSVIIPTFNRVQTFRNTLHSFLQYKTIPSEIIVVDQSDDGGVGIKSVCKAHSLTTECNIKYLYSSKRSLTSARNLGLAKATNDIIIMSDDDVEIYDDTIDSIISVFKDKSISMIACDSLSNTKKESIIGYFLGFKNFFKRKKAYVTKSLYGRYPIRRVKKCTAEWAMGFFFCFRKSICEKGNINWDENLFSYCYAEDLDFSYRYYSYSKKEKMSTIFDRTIKVNHLVSQEYRIPTRTKILMLILNRKYLSYKFGFSRFSRFCQRVTNNIMLIRAFLKRENYKDYYDAIKISKQLNKDNYKLFGKFGGRYIK